MLSGLDAQIDAISCKKPRPSFALERGTFTSADTMSATDNNYSVANGSGARG